MKHLKSALLALAFMNFGSSFGQALQITPGDTISYSGVLTNITENHEDYAYAINNTANGDSIYWRVVSVTMDSVWQMSFCDPNNCYYYTNTIGNYGLNRFWAAAGGSYKLSLGASPSCSADSGKMVIVLWLANDSAASAKTIDFTANFSGSCVSAVQNVPGSNLRVYPTPVNSNMTVDGLNGFKNVKLSIYDVLGNLVIQKYLPQPTALTNVNTDILHAGVYFVTIESEGTKLLTNRIEKLN